MTDRSAAGRKAKTYWVWACWPELNAVEVYGCKDEEEMVQRAFKRLLPRIKGRLLEWHRDGKYALEAKIRSEPSHEALWRAWGFVVLSRKPSEG